MNINRSSLSSIKTTDILPRHDVVFKAPVSDPFYGMPIGNGSMGCLLWFSENELHININHTDLIDDIAEGDFYYKREDETHTVCRNGAEFIVDFGCPVFGSIYQKKFESRISLKDATAKISAETPFCNAKISAFASEAAKTAVVSLNVNEEDEVLLRSKLQRWGSRTFMYWHLRYSPDVNIGLSGTDAKALKSCALVSQKLSTQFFSIAVLPVTKGEVKATAVGNHKTEIEFRKEKAKNIDFYIAVGFGNTRDDAEKEAFSLVAAASEKGKEKIYEEHKNAWANFWNKSYVALSGEDDFIENLWYLNLYYGNSEMKGRYPAHFCNGIWGSYHDYVPWNLYFHYNTQHAFNSYNAANHPELIDTYFNFRRGQLDIAKKYAKDIKGTKGAFYTDISDMMGRMFASDKELSCNCTCGAQIAMLMYKNYLYTGDKNFLEETVLPVMKEIGEFYLDMLKLGEDGRYHIYGTTAYEGSGAFDDCITDLSMIRVLFAVLIKELPENEADIYEEKLSKLVGFTPVEIDADEIDDGKFVFGIGKGNKYKGTKVLTVGIDEEGKRLRKTFGTAEKLANSYYGFPDIEMSPVFPSGFVGIKDKDTELYNQIYNSICMHHPALESEEDKIGINGMCMNWCMMPIYLARMGMPDELSENFRRTVSSWIVFPQGFCLDGPYIERRQIITNNLKKSIYKLDGELKEEVMNFNYAAVKDKPEYKSVMSLWNFRHFNYETLSIISCAVNEMLIQSYDGSIRLFGAVKKEYECSFKLAAQGGFIVSAVYKSGEFYAEIESTRAEGLRIIFDNIDSEIKFFEYETGKALKVEKTDDEYVIKMTKGAKIFALSEKGAELALEHSCEANMDMKILGDARLGEEKRAY